jgi:hypothetical protein
MRDNVDTEVSTTAAGGSAENPFCQYFSNAEAVFFHSFVTMEEFAVCRQAVIDYGKEFILLNPEAPVYDTCTPTLP